MTFTTEVFVPGIDLLEILPDIGSYVVDSIIDEPDGTEVTGTAYLVAALGRGEFSGFSNNIAILTITRGWVFIPPNAGITVYVLALSETLNYDGSSWINATISWSTPQEYGAKGDGVTNDTAAIRAWANSGGVLFAPPTSGGYLTDTVTFNASANRIHMFGGGLGRTTFKLKTAGTDLFTYAPGITVNQLLYENMSLLGAGSPGPAGSGIHFPSTIATPPLVTLRNMDISSFSRNGVYDQAGAFTFLCESVSGGGHGRDNYDLIGGNTTTFLKCYAGQVVATYAGWRIHGGNPLFIGCNGIDSGDKWGVFGDDMSLDGAVNYCYPTFISCNIESFSIGIEIRNGGFDVGYGTTFSGHGANDVAIKCINTPNINCRLERYEAIGTTGTWANGLPIHTHSSGLPLSFLGSNSDFQLIWNDGGGSSYSVSAFNQKQIAFGRNAIATRDFALSGALQSAFCGTSTFASAATATVTFGSTYPTANYSVGISGNANETFWITGKGTGGFTLHSSNATSAASVDWNVVATP